MHLNGDYGCIYVPDGLTAEEALPRTYYMGIGAHPDDLEFMAWSGILGGFSHKDRFFAGVTLTDGGGSSRTGIYADTTDEEMKAVRLEEQKKAAYLGGYAALAALGYSSAQVRHERSVSVRQDIMALIKAARPKVIFTHNLADRHRTHLAAALLVIEALRELGSDYFPEKFYGGEVWRSLDWLPLQERRTFDVGARPSLNMAMMGLYDSQISGGKGYDQATYGRRAANATYADAYAPDEARLLELFMDLRPLLDDCSLSPKQYLLSLIESFKEEAACNLEAALQQ